MQGRALPRIVQNQLDRNAEKERRLVTGWRRVPSSLTSLRHGVRIDFVDRQIPMIERQFPPSIIFAR